MVQLCTKCNRPILDSDMAEVRSRNGHKELTHYICPEGNEYTSPTDDGIIKNFVSGFSDGVKEGIRNIKTSRQDIKYKNVIIHIMIDEDGHYVVADDEEGQDVSDKWEENDFATPLAAQTYTLSFNIPIPRIIKGDTVKVSPDKDESVSMTIKFE